MHTEHHALRSVSKDKLIEIVMKARCGKLVGMRTVEMSKEEIIDHLVASKCPEIRKLINMTYMSHKATGVHISK